MHAARNFARRAILVAVLLRGGRLTRIRNEALGHIDELHRSLERVEATFAR